MKRTKAVQDGSTESLPRRGSGSKLLTLRRPATSRQRAATLQQRPLATDGSALLTPTSTTYPKYSFDRLSSTPELDDEVRGRKDSSVSTRLLSFFHERIARTPSSTRGSSPFYTERSSSRSSQRHPLPNRTIQVQSSQQARAFLTKPRTLRSLHLGSKHRAVQSVSAASDIRDATEEQEENSSQTTPSTRDRRSLSMSFSSPGSWMPRAASIRRAKRGSECSVSNASGSPLIQSSPPTSRGKRHASAPTPPALVLSPLHTHVQPRSVTSPTDLRLHRVIDDARLAQSSQITHQDQDTAARRSSPIPPRSSDGFRIVPGRQRNLSSPLPALSPRSNFHDLSRLGLAISTSEAVPASAKERERHYSESAAAYAYPALPRAFPLVPHSRDVSYARSSTVAGSESEFRGFASSGDDDDTDFKSDTIFDSLRTVASTHVRTTDTPIESMFDESPPNTATKTKRLSIQEILGQSWDSDTRILEEEDEGVSTPMRTAARKSLTPTLPNDHVCNFGSADSGANGILASPPTATRVDPGLSFAHRMSFARLSLDDDDADDDENEDWARIDDSGVTNNLSPPRSQPNSLRGLNGLQAAGGDINGGNRAYFGHRPALAGISGNGSPEMGAHYDGLVGENERVRSSLFDWSESVVQIDKTDADGHSPRPKTVHGKHELDLRGGRQANRKGPAGAHVRSQSVPAFAEPTDGSKPATCKFGTWASAGPKNASEDWDDDFDFDTGGGNGEDAFIAFGDSHNNEAAGVAKGPPTPFAMVVPASIQATQPTVKAHSGQIRELSLLVNGLKRLCRHARDLDIVSESPALWKEAENIIALASPDEEVEGAALISATETDDTETHSDDDWSRRTSAEFDLSGADDRLVDDGFEAGTPNSFDDDLFNAHRLSHPPATPPPNEMSMTTIVRERQGMRRRSVFSPEDDIFGGGWPLRDEKPLGMAEQQPQPQQQGAIEQQRPQTPERPAATIETPDSAMIESIMEAMEQQRSTSAPIRKSPVKTKSTELFFNTNTLQELVKRANTLFHSLSDLVRGAELLTQSPACTPRQDRYYRREDVSPAFTCVFTDPSTPSKRLPNSLSTNSVLSRASPSVESPASAGISQRLQLMTVN